MALGRHCSHAGTGAFQENSRRSKQEPCRRSLRFLRGKSCRKHPTSMSSRPVLLSASALLAEPPKRKPAEFVTRARREIHRLIFTDDKRFLLIVGLCSIHDLDAGANTPGDYEPAREISDRVMIVMRVYFESRARRSAGALIMDPHLDGSHDIAAGLHLPLVSPRRPDLGLPTATEFRPHYPAIRCRPVLRNWRAPPSRRPIARWPRDFRCPWDSRMAPTAPSRRR